MGRRLGRVQARLATARLRLRRAADHARETRVGASGRHRRPTDDAQSPGRACPWLRRVLEWRPVERGAGLYRGRDWRYRACHPAPGRAGVRGEGQRMTDPQDHRPPDQGLRIGAGGARDARHAARGWEPHPREVARALRTRRGVVTLLPRQARGGGTSARGAERARGDKASSTGADEPGRPIVSGSTRPDPDSDDHRPGLRVSRRLPPRGRRHAGPSATGTDDRAPPAARWRRCATACSPGASGSARR